MIYQLLLSSIQDAHFWLKEYWQFGCQPRQPHVVILASDWSKFERGRSLHLSRWHHKLLKILFFEDYIKYRPFWIKIEEAPLGNMLVFIYNNFQQLFCKILSKNQPVIKLVNANEHFLSQSPYYMSKWQDWRKYSCVGHKSDKAKHLQTRNARDQWNILQLQGNKNLI